MVHSVNYIRFSIGVYILAGVSRSYHELIGHRTQLKTKKVNFLVFQKFYLNFAVFLSKLIKTYILLNFIQYYKNF